MKNFDLKIKSISQIPLDKRCHIVKAYCKQFQENKPELNSFSGFKDDVFTLKEHKDYPVKITLKNFSQQYWVRCHKTKTSYVFDIWYAS